MKKIVIVGCGSIAHRIVQGIIYSKGELYGIASRDIKKAEIFAQKYHIQHIYSYEECFQDPQVDLVYIATANPAHDELTKKALENHKHVICEKPFVSSEKEIHELFEIAKKNNCFLMEAHKTCFTPLNQLLLNRIEEIGKIKMIQAGYCAHFDESDLKEWNIEEKMGGSFYDVGVYPICFSNLYANSDIKEISFDVDLYKDYLCDFEGQCRIVYENGIVSDLKCSWIKEEKNQGIIIGENGIVEITNFWKNTIAKMILNGHEEIIEVEQKSDFTGEIDHAIECIEKGLLQSPIMSEKASCQISYVLEKMKEYRSKKGVI